jgi:hypothetical protein
MAGGPRRLTKCQVLDYNTTFMSPIIGMSPYIY